MRDLPLTGDTSAESLLADFLKSGRSDASFSRLIEHLGGLVYGSAFRRTGDSHLAEEITQNVFTILAQKANALAKHSSLTSWLYRTTGYEAEKALRKETRHRRRLERLAHEPMADSHQPTAVSRDTLRLLEQALDHLSTRDRELILARHFHGKKFREIAAQTNTTEAACKVRLRRVLDKMNTWLGKRGCTLGVATLASLLGTELTRACPAHLATKLSATLLQNTAAFSPFTAVITTMNFSKKISILTAILISAVGIPFAIQFTNHSEASTSLSQFFSPTHDREKSARTANRNSSSHLDLENYPYATDRLEELYLKYPNLRRAPFKKPTSPTIIEELNAQYISKWDRLKNLKLPRLLARHFRGKKPWDQEMAGEFLVKYHTVIADIHELTKLSTQPPRYYLNSKNEIEEIGITNKFSKIFRTSLQYHIIAGDLNEATQLLLSQRRISLAYRNGTLVHAFVASGLEKRMKKILLHLTQNGHIVPPLESLPPLNPSELYLEALRTDVATEISLMETLHHIPDRAAIDPQLVIMMRGNGTFNSLKKREALLQSFLTTDFRETQDPYAAIISRGITALEPLMQSNDWSSIEHLKTRLLADNTIPPEDSAPLFDLLTPAAKTFSHIADKIIEHKELEQQIQTLNALNRAQADGLTPESLQDLVPAYLPAIPLHPVTRAPLTYDPEAGSLENSKAP